MWKMCMDTLHAWVVWSSAHEDLLWRCNSSTFVGDRAIHELLCAAGHFTRRAPARRAALHMSLDVDAMLPADSSGDSSTGSDLGAEISTDSDSDVNKLPDLSSCGVCS